MGYRKETDQATFSGIDCYWEADLPAVASETNEVVYPSLPEPYVNLFFHLGAHPRALVKGLASQSAYFTMTSALFGVRLHAYGWLRAGAGPLSTISDRLADSEELGVHGLDHLARDLASASDFNERVMRFRAHVASSWQQRPEHRQEQVAAAIEHVIREFRDPAVIAGFASRSGVSVRTVHRWFINDVGIQPKMMSRIARFHAAVTGLHEARDPGWYYDAGYFDQAHFIREFREFTGLTPEAYRARFA